MHKASGPNVADWQYLGVDTFTRLLEWNYERTGRFSSNLEDGSAHLHTTRIVVRKTWHVHVSRHIRIFSRCVQGTIEGKTRKALEYFAG